MSRIRSCAKRFREIDPNLRLVTFEHRTSFPLGRGIITEALKEITFLAEYESNIQIMLRYESLKRELNLLKIVGENLGLGNQLKIYNNYL